jgi:1-acyl-sn-glycerol-3-phosphate acyltransferase
MMKLISNLVRSLRVLICCLAITARYSLNIIILSLRRRLTRHGVDTITHRWSQYVLRQLDARYQVEGLSALTLKPGIPYIFMSNHVSLMDIVYANDAFPPSLRFIAKKEMSFYPLVGQAMRAGEYLFIDRRNLAQAKLDLEFAKKKLQDGIKLWIFPEGTRGNGRVLLPFKKGGFHLAVEMGAQIIPVGMEDSHLMRSPHWHGMRFGARAVIRVGAPIDASVYDKSDLSALIARTEQAVAALVFKRNATQ